MAYRDKFKLEPLQITAFLRTPVVSDDYLPLDGILLYQAHREQNGFLDFTLPGEYTNFSGITLPLEIEHGGKPNWYYRASWAEWSVNAEGRDYWNKRFDNTFADLIDFDGKRGNVIVEKGTFKAYHQPIYYRSALYVRWYVLGDKSEIERLLFTVTHIGKKTVQGWGRVARWMFKRISNDYSVWKNGKLMRGIPPEEAKEFSVNSKIGLYGIRPSYWKSNNQMPLALP